MRKVKTASFIAMSTVMLYGCGNSAPPECDNVEVLGLVTEIFHNHIRDQRNRPPQQIYSAAPH